MKHNFPYHSVTVMDDYSVGKCVLFMESVREKVTDDIKYELELNGFKYAFIKDKDQ
jgi:hypothetical protein